MCKIACAAFAAILLAASYAGCEVTPTMTETISAPTADQRFIEIRHLDMICSYAAPATKKDWEKRAAYLRDQILTGAGLLPMPAKTPLDARLFGKLDHGDYTIEKVYFESYPGFLVTGNLYRPKGKKPPYPVVLSPHGHAVEGRLEDTDRCSVLARCANFAKQGCIAFAYDMVGYNDSQQLRHREDLTSPREHLWGISMGGLQLWNSIRAVDFVSSLPDADPDRVACTGNSGGGTQTFMLTAVDPRVKAAAPVCMISSYMQGGCVCENPPLIRLDTNNMEIGALAAPRPLILIAATGDWTNKTPDVELPAIKGVYKLYGAKDKVVCDLIDAPHHYNKAGREGVYRWFGRWILGDAGAEHFSESEYAHDKPEDLLIFGTEPKPPNMLDAQAFVASRIQASEERLESMRPRDAKSLDAFRKAFGPALRHALAVEIPRSEDVAVMRSDASDESDVSDVRVEAFLIGRRGKGDCIPALLFTPRDAKGAVLLVRTDGKGAGRESPLLKGLLARGQAVLAIDCFNVGEHVGPPESADRLTRYKFFDTYNRTDTANRVQDILTALAYLDGFSGETDLVGIGDAGLWCLLASGFAPNVNRTVIDASGFDSSDDGAFVEKLYVPCLRNAGDFRTAAALIAPRELLIHNTRRRFETCWLEDVYRAAASPTALDIRASKASDEAIVDWLAQ